jgi:hypothetical protein
MVYSKRWPDRPVIAVIERTSPPLQSGRGSLHCLALLLGIAGSDPGDVSVELGTQVNRCLMDALFGQGCPKIQLIARRTTLEAVERVFPHMDGKRSAPG